MIRTTLAILALTSATPALASDDRQQALDTFCSSISTLATSIMRSRQNGLPLTTLMDVVALKSKEAMTGDMARRMILQAYDQPRFSTDSYKARAVIDFANEAALECHQTFGPDR